MSAFEEELQFHDPVIFDREDALCVGLRDVVFAEQDVDGTDDDEMLAGDSGFDRNLNSLCDTVEGEVADERCRERLAGSQ